MNTRLGIAMALAASAWAAPAGAQNIYRCGDSYSQQPCPGGALVQAEDARSASQRSQTSEAAQRDAKAADAMEKARLKEEAKPVQSYVPAAKSAATVGPGDKKPILTKPKKPPYFTATSPKKAGEPAKKKKAKKAAA